MWLELRKQSPDLAQKLENKYDEDLAENQRKQEAKAAAYAAAHPRFNQDALDSATREREVLEASLRRDAKRKRVDE